MNLRVMIATFAVLAVTALAQADEPRRSRPAAAVPSGNPSGATEPQAPPRPTAAELGRDLALHIAAWPEASRRAVAHMVATYGEPTERTPSMLIWRNSGPWKRSIVYRDEVPHDFPHRHTDVLEQTIDYRFPIELLEELAEFDGSVLADRTRGELTVRCASETMSFAAINLAHQIATDRRNPAQARRALANLLRAAERGAAPEATRRFEFDPQHDTGDPDEPLESTAARR
jgi:hypothetical protein